MAHSEANHSTSVALGVALAGLIALGVTGYFASQAVPLQPVTDASFAFDRTTIDVARLTAERKAPAIPESAKPLHTTLQEAVRQANLGQFGVGELSAEQHGVAVKFAADDLAVAVPNGYDAFVSFGDNMFHTCLSAMQRLQEDLAAGKVTLEAATSGVVAGHEVYAESCGNAIKPLQAAGVLDERGLWVDAQNGPQVFDILNRLRFAHILELRKRPTLLLTDYERDVLYRWRASNAAIPAVERLKHIEQAEQEVKGFPADKLRGKIYFEAGDVPKAAKAYEKACRAHASDAQLQAECAYLNRKAAASQPID